MSIAWEQGGALIPLLLPEIWKTHSDGDFSTFISARFCERSSNYRANLPLKWSRLRLQPFEDEEARYPGWPLRRDLLLLMATRNLKENNHRLDGGKTCWNSGISYLHRNWWVYWISEVSTVSCCSSSLVIAYCGPTCLIFPFAASWTVTGMWPSVFVDVKRCWAIYSDHSPPVGHPKW